MDLEGIMDLAESGLKKKVKTFKDVDQLKAWSIANKLEDDVIVKERIMEMERFKCEFCSKIYSYKHTLMRHIRVTHQPSSSTSYSCGICSKTFMREDVMMRHEKACAWKEKQVCYLFML